MVNSLTRVVQNPKIIKAYTIYLFLIIHLEYPWDNIALHYVEALSKIFKMVDALLFEKPQPKRQTIGFNASA